MGKRLKGKVSIITGASSGVGAAISRRFADEGCRVVLSARRTDRLQSLSDEITAGGGESLAVVADVTDYNQIRNLVDRTVEVFGRVDIMVNNAGFATYKSVEESHAQDIDDQIDVNVKGLFYGSKSVIPLMRAQGGGSIINIGSVASMRTFSSFAVYSGAKHAVLGFSQALYEEVRGYGIRVNVLCPGAINTEFLEIADYGETPWTKEEMIQAADIAEMAMFCVTMPKNVQIESIVAWPTAQAT